MRQKSGASIDRGIKDGKLTPKSNRQENIGDNGNTIEKELGLEDINNFYELSINGYGDDVTNVLEAYIEDIYNLKSKNMRVSIMDSRQSESKYIDIIDNDTDDTIFEVRLSTHMNNEPHSLDDIYAFYDKGSQKFIR